MISIAFRAKRRFNSNLTILLAVSFLTASCLSCKQDKHTSSSRKNMSVNHPKVYMTNIDAPENGARFTWGNKVNVDVRLTADSLAGKVDSIALFANDKYINSVAGSERSLVWSTYSSDVGTNQLKTVTYFNDSTTETRNIAVFLLSDLKPKNYSYRIINVFPHDIHAYTQGLVYEDGYLFESTGQYGQSSLRKEKPENDELLKTLNLESKYFGEGIAVVGDRIIQLTWREQMAFIYDKNSFTLIRKIHFPIQEGWGLAYNGKNLIMSDGSSFLYFLDPEYLSELSRIEVADNTGPVNSLNELEYIDGKVYANVYGKDYIVVIDPESGKVTGKINFSGLLKPEDRTPDTDVLNGIAYNPVNHHLFITGKNWPKLFEVSLTPAP
jgi:glutamine cyclotransferase